MTMYSDKEILSSFLVRELVKNTLGASAVTVERRPGCIIIRKRSEGPEKVVRILLLRPSGYTGNTLKELSPHPEAWRAYAIVRGGVRPGRSGFNRTLGVIFAHYTTRIARTKEREPYALRNPREQTYREEIKPSGTWFPVVREGGSGFYHSLLNPSHEWVALVLRKHLSLQKTLNVKRAFKGLDAREERVLRDVLKGIQEFGDKLFTRRRPLVSELLRLPVDQAVPALIQFLNVPEQGKHEQCTAFALILKFARKDKRETTRLIRRAQRTREAAPYYLRELLAKIENMD